MESFSVRIGKLQVALDSIYLNKFHRELASTDVLWRAMAKIKESAFKKGLMMGVHTLAELYQLPSSFLYDKDTATLHIMVHVPLYYEAHVLTLFRYINTPVQVPWDNTSYFELQPTKAYLARNRDGTLTKTLTEEELADCIAIAHTYFCNDKALRKRNDPTCLNALFDGLTKAIIRECPTRLSSKVSEMTKVGLDRYLVSESHGMRIMSDCLEPGRLSKTFAVDLEAGTHIITVDPNCTTTSENWVIAAVTTLDDVHVASVSIPNRINIKDFLTGIEPEHMDLIMKSLQEVGQPIPLSQVRGLATFTSQMQALDRKYTAASLAFTATGSLTAIVVIGIIIVCLCKGRWPACDSKCCRRKQKTKRRYVEEEEEQYPMRRRYEEAESETRHGRPERESALLGYGLQEPQNPSQRSSPRLAHLAHTAHVESIESATGGSDQASTSTKQGGIILKLK
jgi:hypothetical protein